MAHGDQYKTELEDYLGYPTYNARDPLGRTYPEAMIARGVHPSAQGLHPTYGENVPNWARVTTNLLEGVTNAVHNTLADKVFNTILGVQEIGGNIKKIGDALTPDGYSVPTEGPMRLAGRGVPEPVVSSGPLSRHGYRHHPGGYAIPPNSHLTPEAQAIRDTQGFGYGGDPHYYASHEIPGYDEMVNAGYDSWSPSDAIHNTWTDSNTHGYKPYSEWTQDEKDQSQKEHRRRIDTGLGTLYPGEAADRYYNRDTRSDWQKWKDSVAGGRR